MKDYYKILQVTENSTDDEIKKQYRSLSKQYHPDVNPNGDEMFKDISEAYENISTKEKRDIYNAKRNGNNINFNDIFSNFFGQENLNRRTHKPAPDKMVKLNIDIVDSYLSSEKDVTYFRNSPCDSCKGSGGDRQKCNNCNGHGFKVHVVNNGFIIQQFRTPCDSCGTKGYTLIHKCFKCSGNGVKLESNQIKIKIPHGIDNGQFLKLQNLGDFSNGVFGDLVVQINLNKDDFFDKVDNNLIYKLFLGYNDIKKENYIIPHPNGDLMVQSPSMFDTSKPLRIKGKGFNGGDMYINLFVKFDRVNETVG
jgi:molecular chaperone DnaJ